MAGGDESPEPLQEQKEVQQETEAQGGAPALEEVIEESDQPAGESLEDIIEAAEVINKPLPENVQKLLDFMDDTVGDLNDYVNLNRDVKELDNQDALREYYTRTKPHLDSEEISFLMEDNFSFDEELDDEINIKRKKLALKEQVAEAKTYLDGQKSKYYEDIKAGSKLTAEQQKAIDFFNKHNKESAHQKQMNDASRSAFDKKTSNVFNDKFKGFEYSVGDKNYRFNVKNANEVKNTQSDINNFVGKFTNEKGVMTDAQAYHKSLFTAMNADAVAQHFYDQGKADAVKDRVTKDRNIQVNPRQTHGEFHAGGVKYKVLGDDSNGLKLKIKTRRK